MKWMFFILLILSRMAFGAFESNQPGARPLALSGAVVALPDNPWAAYYNPAGLADSRQFRLHAFYRTFFELPELSQINILANYSLPGFPIAVGVQRYGNRLYSETTVSGAIRYTVSEHIQTGITVNWYNLSISRYGSASAFGLNVGILYQISEGLTLGAQATNINHPQIGQAKEDLPQEFSMGFSWAPFSSLHVLSAYSRDMSLENQFTSALEYQTKFGLDLRFGIADGSDSYSFGLGYVSGIIAADYALLVHQALGISHAISLQVGL